MLIDDRHCIVMDLKQGQCLSACFMEHAVLRESAMDSPKVARIYARLLDLLACAHAAGVDHRDMDTDLIFIQEGGSIQMLGFGAKAALGDSVLNRLFQRQSHHCLQIRWSSGSIHLIRSAFVSYWLRPCISWSFRPLLIGQKFF
jgi:serine/threonine protein kinase